MAKNHLTSSGHTPQQEQLTKASKHAIKIGFGLHRTTPHLLIFMFFVFIMFTYKILYHRFHLYATLENKTSAETFPKFLSGLHVIDRLD